MAEKQDFITEVKVPAKNIYTAISPVLKSGYHKAGMLDGDKVW